ncbi:hypothetical protein GJAV_G00142210 [Gymnothorax javanicus]|nr:hypothetical protein GJAV_G00142210 [Gymnothorax javanicus]
MAGLRGLFMRAGMTKLGHLRCLEESRWRDAGAVAVQLGVRSVCLVERVLSGVKAAVDAGLVSRSKETPPFPPVSDHDVLVIELNRGLNFPATEYISRVLYTEALLVSPARSVVLDCQHVSSLDCTVVEELRDLMRQFEQRKLSVLEVLLSADLQSLNYTESVEAALQALSEMQSTEDPDLVQPLLSK